MSVSVDTRTDGSFTSSGTSLSWSHTINSGSNQHLTVQATVGAVTVSVPTSVTWDSGGTNVAMSNTVNGVAANKTESGGFVNASIWVLVGPSPTGSKTIKVVTSAAEEITGGSESQNGVNQASPYNSASPQSWVVAASTNISQSVTSATGELVVDCECCNETASVTPVVGAGQTQISNDNVGSSNHVGFSSDQPGAATVTVAWTGMTGAGNADSSGLAISLKAAAAGAQNPFIQTEWPLQTTTKVPQPFDPNNLLISTLSLPALKPFKINSDWPNPTIPPKPYYFDPPNILVSTLSLPVNASPFKQFDWPLPPKGRQLDIGHWGLSWFYYYVIDDNVPFYPTQLDNPTASPLRSLQFDPENLILGTLFPAPVVPFKLNWDWPNPTPTQFRSLQFDPENLFHSTLKPTPIYPVQFDNPQGAPFRSVQFDPENLLFSTLTPSALSPFKINSDFPLPPQGPGRWVQFDPENLLFSTLRPKVAITIRNFHGNTFTQVVDRTPGLYVIGPPQFTIANVIPSATTQLFPGPHQGLYIREREAIYTPDGNVWFRWEEDQPSASTPGAYTAGIF